MRAQFDLGRIARDRSVQRWRDDRRGQQKPNRALAVRHAWPGSGSARPRPTSARIVHAKMNNLGMQDAGLNMDKQNRCLHRLSRDFIIIPVGYFCDSSALNSSRSTRFYYCSMLRKSTAGVVKFAARQSVPRMAIRRASFVKGPSTVLGHGDGVAMKGRRGACILLQARPMTFRVALPVQHGVIFFLSRRIATPVLPDMVVSVPARRERRFHRQCCVRTAPVRFRVVSSM